MNLDKHDLFRNAAPGFIFLIVVLSIYAFNRTLGTITDSQISLVALVVGSGFPLGFIIHSLYRILYHIGTGEQRRMEEDDAAIMRRIFKDKTKHLEDAYEKCEQKDKALAHLAMYFFQENSSWKDRIDFLFSYIHALGGAACAILMALVYMLLVRKLEIITFRPLIVIWVVIAVIFFLGREPVKISCRASKELFLRIKRKDISKHLENARPEDEANGK